ncbi:hypothetical protein GvMRE_I1g739 [endosymbiont GvMRE of Glomus versiforme]|nr:hypothetical protein GvMRE_I1g739 [endosymbiont GvMRE of Glomus versiforme]
MLNTKWNTNKGKQAKKGIFRQNSSLFFPCRVCKKINKKKTVLSLGKLNH